MKKVLFLVFMLFFDLYGSSSGYNWNDFISIVNFDGGGYIISTGDFSDRKMLAFSDSGKLDPANFPPALTALLELYATEISNNKEQVGNLSKQVLLSENTTVGPLLYNDGSYNEWGQGAPYNNLTPLEGGEKTWVGCGAMSTAQIMWYWQHPKTGKGSKDDIDFGKTDYRWDLMPAKLTESSTTEEIDAVSTMLYHVGVAMEMRYHYPDPSLTHPSNIAPAIADQEEYGEITPGYFRYHATYDDGFIGTAGASQTAVVLITELDAGRPVQFNALKPVGHGFVCDGYDTKGETEPLNYYFHFNFGWDGQYNGYFLLTAIGPVHETDITFIPNYKIVKEIYPVVETCDDTICSGHGECAENAGIPECLCDVGYYPDSSFRCLPDDDSDIETPDEDTIENDTDNTEGDSVNDIENDSSTLSDSDSGNGNNDNETDSNDASDINDNEIIEHDSIDNDSSILPDESEKKSDGCTLILI